MPTSDIACTSCHGPTPFLLPGNIFRCSTFAKESAYIVVLGSSSEPEILGRQKLHFVRPTGMPV